MSLRSMVAGQQELSTNCSKDCESYLSLESQVDWTRRVLGMTSRGGVDQNEKRRVDGIRGCKFWVTTALRTVRWNKRR